MPSLIDPPPLNSVLREKLARPWPDIPSFAGPAPVRSPALQSAFEAARIVTRDHAKSFYFASVHLPSAKRDAAYAIYAFCRLVDDRIDEAPPEAQPSADDLIALYHAIMDDSATEIAFGPAFAETNRRYAIPSVLYEDLIHGCCMDRQPADFQTFDELETYCYYVASVVGLIMSRVFGLSRPAERQEAIYMGIAMQLTNILRDVKEDLDRGRVYLPQEELSLFGIDHGFLKRGQADERWQAFMEFQIRRARLYYQAGSRGLPALAADGSRQTAALMARVYAGILDELESRNGDVFQGRVFVSLPRKIWIALRMLILDEDTSSPSRPSTP